MIIAEFAECMYNVFLTSIDSKLRQSVWRENLYVEDFEAREGVRPLPSQEKKELYVKKCSRQTGIRLSEY